MLDVLCDCEPAWMLRSPSAPSCERTFTTCSSPLELPAATLGALSRPNNIGHDLAVLSMNWPHTSCPAHHVREPRTSGVVGADAGPTDACLAKRFKSTVASRKVCPRRWRHGSHPARH